MPPNVGLAFRVFVIGLAGVVETRMFAHFVDDELVGVHVGRRHLTIRWLRLRLTLRLAVQAADTARRGDATEPGRRRRHSSPLSPLFFCCCVVPSCRCRRRCCPIPANVARCQGQHWKPKWIAQAAQRDASGTCGDYTARLNGTLLRLPLVSAAPPSASIGLPTTTTTIQTIS